MPSPQSTNVGGTAYTNCSWGIYANGTSPAGGNRTVAYRGFASSLTTNVTFELQWMSEGIGFGSDELWRICFAQRQFDCRCRFVSKPAIALNFITPAAEQIPF